MKEDDNPGILCTALASTAVTTQLSKPTVPDKIHSSYPPASACCIGKSQPNRGLPHLQHHVGSRLHTNPSFPRQVFPALNLGVAGAKCATITSAINP